MTPSHRLKIQRAEKHLEDLGAMLATTTSRKPYPVSEIFEPNGKKPGWVYRLDLSEAAPDEMFPIVLGDFLFNVRSALDQLVVGCAPANRKYKVSFPICAKDPLAVDQASGDYVNAEAASEWLSRTKGLPSDLVANLQALQPYENARKFSKQAEDHPLTILSALQNADKHRESIGVVTGLKQVEWCIEGIRLGHVPVIKHDTVLETSEHQVQVEIEGAAVVGLGRGNKIRDWDLVTGRILDFVAIEVLRRVEPFLRR